MDTSTNHLPIGTIIGASFEIMAVLGRGANAVVYRAKHQITEKDVALKLLDKNAFGSNDAQRQSRFENEAKTASQLDHPNIVKLLSFGFHEETPFLVMELINGVTLEQHLANNGRLSISQFQHIFSNLLSGLEYLHQAKIIHRDIKPGNILLENSFDNSIVPKLSDFGLAKALQNERSQNLTATNEIPGTPAYMSPEQCQKGELSQSSDIYALGCVMYESLTLTPPFQAANALDLMYKHANEKPPSLKDAIGVPQELDNLISKCLKKAVSDRWSSAAELREALLGINPAQQPAKVNKIFVIVSLLALASLVCYTQIGPMHLRPNDALNLQRKNEPYTDYAAMSPTKALAISEDLYIKSHNVVIPQKILDSLKPRLKKQLFTSAARRSYYTQRYLLETELRNAESALAATEDRRRQIDASPAYEAQTLDRIQTLVWRCQSLALLHRFKEAQTALSEARKILRLDDRRYWEMIEQAACDTYFLQGEFADSIKISQALQAPHAGPDVEREAINHAKSTLLRKLSLLKIYGLQHDKQKLSQTFDQCKAIFRENPDLNKQMKELFSYASALIDSGFIDEAKTVLQAASNLTPAEKQVVNPVCGRIWQALGKIELVKRHFAEADLYYKRSLELCSYTHACETATALLARAYIASKTGHDDQCSGFLTLAAKLPLTQWIAIDTALQNVDLYIASAQLYKARGEVDGAKRCYECALALPEITVAERKFCEGQMKSLQR